MRSLVIVLLAAGSFIGCHAGRQESGELIQEGMSETEIKSALQVTAIGFPMITMSGLHKVYRSPLYPDNVVYVLYNKWEGGLKRWELQPGDAGWPMYPTGMFED